MISFSPKITNLKYIVNKGRNRNQYALYGLQMTLNDTKSWMVERRFSDFVLLRDEIHKCMKHLVSTKNEFNLLPKLPPKTFITLKKHLQAEFLSNRGKGLKLFMRDLISFCILVLTDIDEICYLLLVFRIIYFLSRFLGIHVKNESTFKLRSMPFERILEQFSHFSEIVELGVNSV